MLKSSIRFRYGKKSTMKKTYFEEKSAQVQNIVFEISRSTAASKAKKFTKLTKGDPQACRAVKIT